MQQTENLKLNLIETGDPISPAPLNENAQKLEAALAAEAETRAAGDEALAQADAALSGRVTALEAKKIYFGSYTGTGGHPQFVNLGYTPAAVILCSADYGAPLCAVPHSGTMTTGWGEVTLVRIVENGIELFCDTGNYNRQIFNEEGAIFYYIAFV